MSVAIDVPAERVWDELARIGDIGLNSPTVDRSALSSEIAEGIGATRHMEMSIAKNATLDERVIAWDEGRSIALEVYEMDGVTGVQTMGGSFAVTTEGDHSRLTSTLNYSMSNGFFGSMNRLMLKRKFSGLWTSVLAGYKHHIETGEHATTDTRLDLGAVELHSIEVDAAPQEQRLTTAPVPTR
ncbi:MAG: SRPBCC family protein [Deltaproteobacteria bacterium]|nr:SRPBCC family protein [Deltaproteobacteria bacterium]